MSTGKWETVSHKKKASASDKKAARKALKENAPILDDAPPLKEDETLFSAAFHGSKANNVTANHKKPEALSPKKGSVPQKKKKDNTGGKKKLEKFSNLEDALRNISLEDIMHQWEDVRTRCPDAPSLWLGDIVGFLNRKLEVKESEPAFMNEEPDFPCCKLNPDLKEFLSNTLVSYDYKMLKEFFDYCLREMFSDLTKGQPVHAYRIFIQLLIWKNPQLVTKSCKIFLDLAKKKHNDRIGCLAVLWTANQAGLKNSVTALHVWSQVMLPMLSYKIVAPYVVASLERLFSGKLDPKKANNVFGPTEFFPLLDVVYTSNATLPPNLQKQLQNRYAKLKTIAVGSDPQTSLRNFFPSYLERTTKNCPEPLKSELLKSLLECLATDVVCFSVWRQMYDTHMGQSGVLLNYMKDNWDKVDATLPRRTVHETIRAFNLTNEELVDSQGGNRDYATCRKACGFLLEKMQRKSFPWGTVIFVLVAAIISFLLLDIINSQGFKKSRTRDFLDKAGLLLIFSKVWTKISMYGGLVVGWLAENVPVYYAKACELCGPYLSLLSQKLYWLGLQVIDLLQPILAWLQDNVPKAIHWVEDQMPYVLETTQNYIISVWEYIVNICILIWTMVSPFLIEVWDAIAYYSTIVWESVKPALGSAWLWMQNSVGKT